LTDALVIYEILHGPSEGYFSTLLYDDDFKKGFMGRLQLCYDLRVGPRPFWQLVEFQNPSGLATQTTELTRDEVYGYLKARFPKKDWRKFVCKKVKAMTMKLFEDEKARVKEAEA